MVARAANPQILGPVSGCSGHGLVKAAIKPRNLPKVDEISYTAHIVNLQSQNSGHGNAPDPCPEKHVVLQYV